MAGFFDNLVQGAEQGIGGFFGGLAHGVEQIPQIANTVGSAIGQRVLSAPQNLGAPGPNASQQDVMNYIRSPQATQSAMSFGMGEGAPTSAGGEQLGSNGQPLGPGFFQNLIQSGIKKLTGKDDAAAHADGQQVQGEANQVDQHVKAVANTPNTNAAAGFTPAPNGGDTQYTFNDLKNPDALLKTLSNQGVAASFDSNGNVVAHDTDNLAKGIISQISKDNRLEPTVTKGEYNIQEGDNYAASQRPAVQPNAESTSGTVPNQAAKDSGSVQDTNVPAKPVDTGGQSQEQVLADQVRNKNSAFNKANTDKAIQNAVTGDSASLDDPKRFQVAKEYNKWGDDVTPDSQMKVYKVAPGPIDEPTYVGTNKASLLKHYGDRGELQEATVRVGDLHDGGGLGNEFVYVPPKTGFFDKLQPAEKEMGKALGLSDEQILAAKKGMQGERLQPGDTPGVIAKDTVPQEVDDINQENFSKATGGKPEEPVVPQPKEGAKSRVGNLGKDLLPEERDALQTFMRDKKVVNQEADLAAKKFEPLRDEGMDAIHAHQAGATGGLHDELTKLAKTTFQALKDNATPGSGWSKMNERENYLPQIWAGLKNPRAFLSRVYETYEEGIKEGLDPKYQNMPDLVKWYVKMANNAIAKGKMLNSLEKAGRIVPQAEEGLEQLSGTSYFGTPSLADAYNNFVKPQSTILTKIANVTRGIVRGVFSTGVPGTGLNFHIVANELPRKMLATSNIAHIPATGLVRGLVEAIPDMLLPGRSAGILKENAPEVIEFQKGSEWTAHTPGDFAKADQAVKGIVGKVLGKLGSFSQKAFTQPMSDIINGWQYNFIKTNVEKAVAGGMDRAEAIKAYGAVANKMFGTLNYNEMFRGQGAKNLADIVAQTPQFVESSLRLPASLAKSVTTNTKGPEAQAYRAVLGSAVSLYAIANVVNKSVSGHWMYQNQPNHQFSIEFSSDGKGNTFPVFGSTGTLLNEVGTAGKKLAGGDISGAGTVLRNRLSPTTGLATDLLTNTNYAGKQLTSPKQTALQNAGDVANTVGQATLPIGIQSAIQALTGQQSPAVAIARSAGIPITQPNKNPNFGTVQATQGSPFQQALAAITSGGGTSNPLASGTSTANPLASSGSQSSRQASQRRAASAQASRARRSASRQSAAAGRSARRASSKLLRSSRRSSGGGKIRSPRIGGRRRG